MQRKLFWTALSIFTVLTQAHAQPISRHAKPFHPASAKRKSHAPAPAPFIVFFDDFSDSRRTSLQWQETSNGGDLAFTGSSLQVKGNGTGCPHLTTRNPPFPVTGNWTATFAFRYTRIAPYGTTIGLGKAGGDYVACVHQDQTGQYLQMNGKNLTVRHADTDWHVVSFVKKGSTLAFYLDGAQVGADTAQDAPVALQFGGGHVDNPGQWNDQEVQFVRVDRDEKVLDKTALLKVALTNANIPSIASDSSSPDGSANGTNSSGTIPFTDDGNATLAETFAWITRTINNSSGVNDTDGKQFEVWDTAEFDQDDLLCQYRMYLPYSGWNATCDIRIPFDKLDADKVHISISQPDATAGLPVYYEVKLQCAGNAKLISSADLLKFQAPIISKQNRSSEGIRFEDKEMAIRFAKAVLHAVRLCKVSKPKEPF